MNRYLIPLIVFLSLIVLFVVGLQYDPRRVPSPLIDKPAPAFVLPQLKNPQQSLASNDLKGDVVMLNVWASWCVACRQEHPLLMQLANSGKINIIGLNYKDTREDAMRWLEQYGDPYLVSAFDQQGRVGIDYGVYGVPETYIIDKNGIIRYKHIGPINADVLKSTILPLINNLNLDG